VSTAKQSDAEGHETPVSAWVVSIRPLFHVTAAPVGFVECKILPPVSTAKQSDAEGHETPVSAWVVSIRPLFHVTAAPVGFVECKILPPVSTAKQSDAEGHETPVSAWVVSIRPLFHVTAAPAIGIGTIIRRAIKLVADQAIIVALSRNLRRMSNRICGPPV
jgi:hypothetical protein